MCSTPPAARPRRACCVVLERATHSTPPHYQELGRGTTDADGRLRTLLAPDAPLSTGTYRLTFDTGTYFANHGVEGFYPEVTVLFVIRDDTKHYHVPLLLSPFGYSTYRGS